MIKVLCDTLRAGTARKWGPNQYSAADDTTEPDSDHGKEKVYGSIP